MGWDLSFTTPLVYATSVPTGGQLVPAPDMEILSLSYSTQALGGFYRAQAKVRGDSADLLELQRLLGKRVIISHSGTVCWEGIVVAVNYDFGLSYTFDGYANAVMVEYSDRVGSRAWTDWATDSTKIALHGRHEYVYSFDGATPEAANRLRDLLLYFRSHTMAQDTLTFPARPVPSVVEAQISAVGFYATLGWEYWQDTTEGDMDTGQQIAMVVQGRASSGNRYIYLPSTTTGVSCSRYQPDQWPTLQDRIEQLLKYSNSASQILWLQVWESQRGTLAPIGGGDFPQPDYYSDGTEIIDANGKPVPLFLVRADRVLMTNVRLPRRALSVSDPLETPSGMYIRETEVSWAPGTGLEVSLSPASWQDFAEMVYRLGFP